MTSFDFHIMWSLTSTTSWISVFLSSPEKVRILRTLYCMWWFISPFTRDMYTSGSFYGNPAPMVLRCFFLFSANNFLSSLDIKTHFFLTFSPDRKYLMHYNNVFFWFRRPVVSYVYLCLFSTSFVDYAVNYLRSRNIWRMFMF